MKRIGIVASLLFALLGACGGDGKGKTASRETDPGDEKVSENGKRWGGWRWKGKRNRCYYIVGNRCFETEAEACKAAGCKAKGCRTDDSAPIQVSCAKTKTKS